MASTLAIRPLDRAPRDYFQRFILQSRPPHHAPHLRLIGKPPARRSFGRDFPESDADTVGFDGAEEIPTADLDPSQHEIRSSDAARNCASADEASVPLPYFRHGQPAEESSNEVTRTDRNRVTGGTNSIALRPTDEIAGAAEKSEGPVEPIGRPAAPSASSEPAAEANTPLTSAVTAAPTPRDVTSGTVLRDRYVVEHVVGIGGNSVVFQAIDRHRNSAEEQNERVALKVLRPQLRDNPYALMRMRREFRQMQCLTHGSIARVFDLDCDGDIWFMTLELVAGRTITQWMKGTAPDSEAMQIITGCCEAVSYAHSHGIVHGDLKPSNVLITPDMGIKLVDFGSAAAESSGAAIAVSARSFAATPPYASPQILTGNLADPRDDVFSLACLAYAVLTRGEHPFERRSSLDAYRDQMRPVYSPKIQPRVFDVIVRGLSWQRPNRQASAAEFLNALISNDLGREFEPLRKELPVVAVSAVNPASVRTPNSLATLSTQYPMSPGAIYSVPVTLDIPPSRRYVPSLQWLSIQPWSGVAAERFSSAGAVNVTLVNGSSSQWTAHSIALSGASPVPVLRPAPETIEGELLVRARAPALVGPSPPPHQRATIWQRHGLAAVAVIGVLSILLGHESDVGSSTRSDATLPAPIPVVAQPAAVANTAPIREITEASLTPTQPNIVEHVVPPLPAAAGFVSFDNAIVHVGSGQSMAVLTVKRLASTQGRARIGWTVEGGSAKAVVDERAIDSRTIQFLDGQEVRSLYIPLLTPNDPGEHQPTRSFTVKLVKLQGSPAIGPLTQTKVSIASGY